MEHPPSPIYQHSFLKKLIFMIEDEDVHEISGDLLEVFTELLMTAPMRQVSLRALLHSTKDMRRVYSCWHLDDQSPLAFGCQLDQRQEDHHWNPALNHIPLIESVIRLSPSWRSRRQSLQEQLG